MTVTYRLPQIKWDAPIIIWGQPPVDYAHLEKWFAPRRLPNVGETISWRTNGTRMAGRVIRRRRSRDYEVILLNTPHCTHIVVVQLYEIEKIGLSPLETLAATV
jgi:hypothetical protein